MPRLDNSDPMVLDIFDLEYDPNDPGRTNPVDICNQCYEMSFSDFECCEHPPYAEQDPSYICAWCGFVLNSLDD